MLKSLLRVKNSDGVGGGGREGGERNPQSSM